MRSSGCGCAGLGLVDGESEALGAEDGVEADEAFVRGEENYSHECGEGEICCVGAALAAQEIAAKADAEHADGGGGEWTAEESHG